MAIAGMIFRGENIDPELWEDCQGAKWERWVQLFLPLCSNQDGHFVHWPFAGSYMDQPAATMRILQAVQTAFQEYAREATSLIGG
jgi:hypothetical protein